MNDTAPGFPAADTCVDQWHGEACGAVSAATVYVSREDDGVQYVDLVPVCGVHLAVRCQAGGGEPTRGATP